jgi:hypothetical protein
MGEPPLILAISLRKAIHDAVAAFGAAGDEDPLAVPSTQETRGEQPSTSPSPDARSRGGFRSSHQQVFIKV